METSVVNNTVQNLPQTYIPQQGIYQKSDVQSPGKYWDDRVYEAVRCGSWSKTDVHHRVNLQGWLPYLKQLPRDPYVDSRWKRMSWFYLNQSGEPVVVPDCPMAQAGAFNDAETMADKVRHYAPLEDDFIRRKDVSEFIKGWAGLWDIQPGEPILMQINGVRGNALTDPLQGQGIHKDGSQFLSVLVINRENVSGGTSLLSFDKQGQQEIISGDLAPGEILHIRDDQIYHSVSGVKPLDASQPFERFIIIINCRFNDSFQNRILREYFPGAVLNEW
ncbi:2OG-Fe dioxygenase family protein [Amphritea atlantica]|uniref:2OG-Fe dioxygenase family protein n=1 Tax=Amphritea atlantica TaxID=355243 RepID=A0ABY5GYS7_9GAMM|nr:2OG-Fe dioxygenase family protein [Amphritea atlantica]